jgi:AAA domain
MDFPEISYVVPGIIPEGLTILAGRPKVGKSWMALDLAIGIATGKTVLGGLHVEQGDVLYCCLEDNPRRLQRRVTKLLSPFSNEWPERLTLATRWRRLDQGGVKDIEEWCGSVPEPRLVLLDTLAGVRPARSGTDTLYEGDYKALRDVHRFANERGMGAVALHHTRKMDADDPVDTISGSLGLAGAADTCLILARSSKGTTLYVRGRDIEEGERAITSAPKTASAPSWAMPPRFIGPTQGRRYWKPLLGPPISWGLPTSRPPPAFSAITSINCCTKCGPLAR